MSGPSWGHFTNSLLCTPGIPYGDAFILRYLSSEILKKRHYLCGARYTTAECTPRVDAQASATRTGIGGWYPARNNKGELDPWCSDWFSLEISKEDFPWIFEKSDKPSLVISTLEALAILISLKLRFGDAPDSDDTKVLIVPSITDNRGNGAVLNKLMTTRFPSSGLLMEMGSYMKSRGMRAIVEWAPREFNKEGLPIHLIPVEGYACRHRHSPGISFPWRFRQVEIPNKETEKA